MRTKTDEYARPATPPDTSSLAEVREASRKCTACHLYKRATQTVFGEGPKGAPMMLVGEQQAITKMWPANLSLDRQKRSWIARLKKPESIEARFTLRMR
jgi:hypothetical protein